jgi:hypothetical protein
VVIRNRGTFCGKIQKGNLHQKQKSSLPKLMIPITQDREVSKKLLFLRCSTPVWIVSCGSSIAIRVTNSQKQCVKSRLGRLVSPTLGLMEP